MPEVAGRNTWEIGDLSWNRVSGTLGKSELVP